MPHLSARHHVVGTLIGGLALSAPAWAQYTGAGAPPGTTRIRRLSATSFSTICSARNLKAERKLQETAGRFLASVLGENPDKILVSNDGLELRK